LLTALIHGYESKSTFDAHETAPSYFLLLDNSLIVKEKACKGKKKLKE
jgi:hypothetical protein